jgi:hypothetical protein
MPMNFLNDNNYSSKLNVFKLKLMISEWYYKHLLLYVSKLKSLSEYYKTYDYRNRIINCVLSIINLLLLNKINKHDK